MWSPRNVELTEVNEGVYRRSEVPTISGVVRSYYVSHGGTGGWSNSAFSTSNDEGANSFYTAGPQTDIFPNGKQTAHPTNNLDVSSSPVAYPNAQTNSEKDTNCCKWCLGKNSCRILLAIILIIVFCAIVVGVVVGLVLGLSGKGNGAPAYPAKTLYLAGTLRINKSWEYDLDDQSSLAYRVLSAQVFEAVSSVLNSSSYANDYILHDLITFSPGSVLAAFRLDIRVTTGTEYEILIILQEGFQILIDQGLLPWYLDPKSDIWLKVCEGGDFWCPNETCLLQKFVCDRNNDCGDYSDERNCTCLKTEFRCDMGLCIDSWRHCDKKFDCPDKSDEVNCVCPMGQFLCGNGTCIMSEWICDREKDCPGGEDEFNCSKCTTNQFQCRDYSCISSSSHCDGVTNCPDASDEQNCVRQGTDLIIQGFSASSWLPFCSDNIPDVISNEICLALGMSDLLSSSSVTYISNKYLSFTVNKTNSTTSYNLMASFVPRPTCPNNLVLVLQCSAKVCGVSALDSVPQSLIVHGTDAAPGKWPWQVAIYKNLMFLCGGSLVDQYHILTAAHCMTDRKGTYTILLGSNKRSSVGTTGLFRQVGLFEIHPKYERYYLGYDIAMLTMKEPVNFTDYIRPVCLTEPEESLPLSSLCYSTGWGNTDFNRSEYLPETLQQAKMRLWSFEECQYSYPFATRLMMCAGYASGYIANCPGDSGGPLVCKDLRGFWKLVGIFSFLTKGCSVPLKPSVFTNVQELYSWIQDQMTCRFFCNNGKCIWDLTSLCDGVNDCGDWTDEQKTCNASISCNFEEKYICGYRNLVQMSQLVNWERHSGAAGINEGPITDVTYGNNSGNYMYARGSRSILLAPIYHQVAPTCLQFKLNVRAIHCGSFKVFIQPTTFMGIPPINISLDNITVLFEWPPDFCQIDLWQVISLNISAGTYVLGFEAYADIGQSSASMAIDDVHLMNGSCSSQVCNAHDEFTCKMENICIPKSGHCNYYTNCVDESDELVCDNKSYSCNFERYGACGIEQFVLDSSDWMVHPAIEASKIAGCPKLDHTFPSPQGNIFFISTLYGQPGDLARVSLPIKTPLTPGCLEFYFSMVSQGRLKVDYVSGNNNWVPVWSITQVNDSSWQLIQLVLPVGVRIINIDGIIGVESSTATTSYIAIDDISILEGNCSKPVCATNEFACDSGQCIYHEHICDGIQDCLDDSDEKPSLCVCVADSFHCASGQCLKAHVRCDGINNCADGSDERNCTMCDSALEYKCVSDGRCKLRSTWCDGMIDCHDGSDELLNCTCLPEQTQCTNGHCILSTEYCNGKVNCADGSDEPIGCAQFHCLSGSLIPWKERCDGIVNCQNADDEQDCECLPTDFRCTAGRCINQTRVCNGVYDCPDRSDERNCTCALYEFKCSNGLCLPSYSRCNGYNECGDYSDEQGCTCQSNQFHCANGICIYNMYRCDFNDDCGDGSDELNCSCKPKEIRCSDGKCLQPQWICDGYPDCKDGSDELNCTHCDNSTQFTCRTDYTCIPLSWRCDGKADCDDSSDEHKCVIQQNYNTTINLLYGYRNESFYPLCAEFWSEEWSVGVCAAFGSSDMVSVSSVVLSTAVNFLKIRSVTAALTYNLSYLDLTTDCPNRSIVRLNCLPATCGTANYSSIVPYIVRGNMATEGQWPWAAALQYNGIYRCTAVLISENWLMTAAHCIFNSDNGYSLASVPQYFTALLGTTKRTGYSSHLQVATFRHIFVHPNFSIVNNIQYNDVALLQLSNSVRLDVFTIPVCLPTNNNPGPLCYAVGWGLTTSYDTGVGAAAVDLRQAKMDIWSYDVCSQPTFWGSRVTNDTQLCAGYVTDYIAMCQGDSGGPLMCRDLNNKWTLRGIVSTGTNPCVQNEPAKPTIFANVNHFMPWIASVVSQFRLR